MTTPKIPDPYAAPRIIDPVSLDVFVRGCSALGLTPEMVLRDPAWTLRIVASSSVDVGQQFINIVCLPGTAPDLERMPYDLSALYVTNVFLHIADQVRRHRRSRAYFDEETYEVPA